MLRVLPWISASTVHFNQQLQRRSLPRRNDGFVPFEASTGEQRLSWSSHRCVRCSTPICAGPHPSIVDANQSFAQLERRDAAESLEPRSGANCEQRRQPGQIRVSSSSAPPPQPPPNTAPPASPAAGREQREHDGVRGAGATKLGFAHHVGFGVARDARVACELTQASAAHGILGAAHYNLGVLRMKGEDNGGGSDDVISASTSSGAATSRGNDDDDDDDRAAVAHFRLAADLDHVPAQHALAMLINAGSRAALDDDLRGGNNNAGTENNGSRRDGASDSSTSASIAIAAAAQ